MSWQLTNFVNPITGSLEELQGQFAQLATLHRDAHTRLRSQGNSLTAAGGLDAFTGDGAVAFANTIEFYISTSEKPLQILDQAASTAGRCINDIIGAVGVASSNFLDEGMVSHILGNLTHDAVIRDGGNAVIAILNDMKNTLNNMINTGGSFFGHLFTGHPMDALHDVSQEFGDVANLASDALSLLESVGQVLTQWAQSICDAIGNCLKTIGTFIWDVVDFVLGISSIIHDIQVIFDGKASFLDKLLAVGDLVFNVGTDVLLVFGVGEEIRGGELLLKGGIALTRAQLIAELKKMGIKFTEEDIVAIIRSAAGKINWLEIGDLSKGLEHIIARHGSDFANIGVTGKENVIKLIMDTLSTKLPIGLKKGGQIFEVSIDGVVRKIIIVVGDNGFIVTAYPF